MSSKSATHTQRPSKTISVGALRVGMRLSQDIYDSKRVLLLSAGTEITPRFLRALESRSIQTVVLKPSTLRHAAEALQTEFTRQLDEILVRNDAFGATFAPSSPERSSPESVQSLSISARKNIETHAATGRVVVDVCRSLDESGEASVDDVQQAVRQFVDMIGLDADLLPTIVAMQQPQNEYLFDHCVNVSLLSMTIGRRLGLTTDRLIEVGCGALLQDIGMLSIPESIRLAPRRLNLNERLELQRHPIYTLERLERINGLASNVAFVGYQAHERIDGSGYPRNRSGHFIHQYAKIVAVADVYAAMTRPRPHRPPVIPYLAAKTLVFEAHYDKLDRDCVRAFLDCMSLFPIGSIVELSNGLRARTVRGNPDAHTRPIVCVVDEQLCDTHEVIDLSADRDVEIRRVLIPDELGPVDSSELTPNDAEMLHQ